MAGMGGSRLRGWEAGLQGSRLRWEPCRPVSGGWRGRDSSGEWGMAGSPAGVAALGGAGKDGQAVCVDMLVRLAGREVAGLGSCRRGEGSRHP